MAKKRKSRRGRGRPSFESSYKVRVKEYRRYQKKWKENNEKYGGKIGLKLDYKEFADAMLIARERARAEGKRYSGVRLANEQIDVTSEQGSAAAQNFNRHLREMREKAKNGEPLTEYEKAMLDEFGYNFTDLQLREYDMRAGSLIYDNAYDIAKEYGMGSEAFGS